MPNQNFNYDSILNAMWNVIVTLTTVGYGDYFPRTLLGRAVAFMMAFWGVFIVSMMVVTLTNSLNMSPLEIKAFTIFSKLCIKEELKESAASIITGLVKAKYVGRKAKNPKKEAKRYVSKLKEHLKNFKTLNRF